MRIAVVGAGLSGLVAARELGPDHDVIVLERARSVGGRLATRRIGDAVLDHGAQFFTVRGEALGRQVDDWLDRGVASVWCHGFHGREDGYPRYVGAAGMNSLAKDLARGLAVRTDRMVFTLRRPADRADGWDVVIDDGSVVDADAVILACPVPQSWALLAQAARDEPIVPDDLARTDFHRTIALLVTLDRPGAVPDPGGVQFDPDDEASPFGFIGDNQAKGVSPAPAITFHATQPWSRAHWDDDVDALRAALLERAAPWLGDAQVVEAQVKKWRFAGPVTPWPDPCFVDRDRRIVLAGDVFAGPKVEGAYNSGLAAAGALRSHLNAGDC